MTDGRHREITEQDGTSRLVLKDGSEIHRIGPVPEVYDTGRLIGRDGQQGAFVRLAAGQE